jgi:hypothetical protein
MADGITPDDLRPSIVLFETQKFAFTHDRADNAAMLQASEWISKKEFERLQQQYQKLEIASEVIFKRSERIDNILKSSLDAS